MDDRIYPIRNALRIWESNIILVPGNEPISTVTSVSNVWSHNPFVKRIEDEVTAAYISLTRALEVIPDATIMFLNPHPAYRYFVLPKGPPPHGNECPCGVVEDYYRLLRENADVGIQPETQKPTLDQICAGFDYNFCQM